MIIFSYSLQRNERSTKAQANFFESFEDTPLIVPIITYLGYAMLYIFGKIRDFLRTNGFEANKQAVEPEKTRDFVPLYQSFESFYTRNIYRRLRDCWNRPIQSVPGAEFEIVDRKTDDYGWTFRYVIFVKNEL